jgi:hypothetical protein
MKRKTPLKTTKPMAKSNAKRKKARFLKAFGSRERVLAIKAMPCLVCGALPSDNAHIKSRGAGGSFRDVVPLCRNHHQEHHAGPKALEAKYGLNLREAADALAADASLPIPMEDSP